MTPETVVWWSGKGPNIERAPSADLMEPVAIRSAYMNKPTGGIWTSPETCDYGWEDWCRDNEPEWLGRRWRLHVTGKPPVLVIDSHADLMAAFDRYPHVEERLGYVQCGVDWLAVGRDYDAVWLTAEGHFDSRLSDRARRAFDGPNTYSWDCESVFWYRWSFDRVEPADRELASPLSRRGQG